MHFPPFPLERFFARHEFSARHLLGPSGAQPLNLGALLRLPAPPGAPPMEDLSLGYVEPAGHPAIRDLLSEMHPGTSSGRMLLCAPQEGLFLALNALLGPRPRPVVLTWPAYGSLAAIPRSLGCPLLPWKARHNGPQTPWRFDLQELEDLIARNEPGLLILNLPHNPTGATLSPEEQKSVVALAERRGIPILGDGMYRGLEETDTPRLPLFSQMYDRAADLGGLSKNAGLPGLRAGWLIFSGESWHRSTAALKDYTTICGCAPGEWLTWRALFHLDALLGAQRKRLDRNRQHLVTSLEQSERLSGWMTWHPPRAGTVAWLEWRGPGTAAQFGRNLIRDAGILLVPGALMGEPGSPCFRLGLGREAFPEDWRALTEYLSVMEPSPDIPRREEQWTKSN